MDKEKSVGNPNVMHLTSRDMHRDRREMFFLERYHEKLFNNYRDAVRENKYTFFVVELDSPSQYDFKKFHEAATHFAKHHTYLIEIMQPEDIVKKYAKNKKDDKEALEQIEEMKKPPPKEVMLLDAGPLYDRDRLMDKVNSIIDRYLRRNDFSIKQHDFRYFEPRVERVENSLRNMVLPDPEDKSKIREALKNPDFVRLIQSKYLHLKIDHRSYQPEPIEPDEEFKKFVKSAPSFTAKENTNYNHNLRNKDDYEFANNFRPTKVIDYEHKTTENLLELRSRTEIEQKIQVSLNKKIKNEIEGNFVDEEKDSKNQINFSSDESDNIMELSEDEMKDETIYLENIN